MPAHVQRAWEAGVGPLGSPRLRAAHSLGLPPLHTQLVCSELLQTAFPVCLFPLLPASIPALQEALFLTPLSPSPLPPFSLSLSNLLLFLFPLSKQNPLVVLPKWLPWAGPGCSLALCWEAWDLEALGGTGGLRTQVGD